MRFMNAFEQPSTLRFGRCSGNDGGCLKHPRSRWCRRRLWRLRCWWRRWCEWCWRRWSCHCSHCRNGLRPTQPSVPAAVGKFPPKICCKAANMGCDMGWLKTLTVTLVALAGRDLGLHPSAAKSPGFVGLPGWPGDPWHGIGGTCPMSPLAPAALGTRGSTDPWGHPGPPPGTAMATHDGKESSHVAVEKVETWCMT